MRVGVCAGLNEVGHAYSQVGIGEKLDDLSLGADGEQSRNVLLDGTLFEQFGDNFGAN